MRALVRFLVALVVLGLVAFGADRAADFAAERQLAGALQQVFGAQPDVDVTGFPFLTQWGSGHYAEIDVANERATVAGTTVRDVTVSLADLRLPPFFVGGKDIAAARAGRVTMSATVSFADLPLPAGVDAARQGHSAHRVRLTGSVDVLDQPVRFTAVARVGVRDGRATLRPTRVDVRGVPATLSDAAATVVRDHLALSLDPPGLPAGTELRSVRVADGGIRVTAAGTDMRLPGS